MTNNAQAIQNAFNQAASNHCAVLIPAGIFAYSGVLTANSIAVVGTGADSVLKPLDVNNETLELHGSGASVSNLHMISSATSRISTYQGGTDPGGGRHHQLQRPERVDRRVLRRRYLELWRHRADLVEYNTVENTLADSITQTDGANNIVICGNKVINSGDDGISNNTYSDNPTMVNHITVEDNSIIDNIWGRGLEVSGGDSITFTDNYVDNKNGYADMYIASESEWDTQSVSNITVTNNTFVDGGPNQGSLIIYNSAAGSITISGVTVSGNQFVNPALAAVQITGSGTENQIQIENNTDYSTTAFSTANDPAATVTETGNSVLATSAFTTPLAAPGGGCNFSGC